MTCLAPYNKSCYRIFLYRNDTQTPWGVFLDEKMARVSVYVVQELDESEAVV